MGNCYPNIELKLFGAHEPPGDKRDIFDLRVHYYEPADTEKTYGDTGTLEVVDIVDANKEPVLKFKD